MTRIEFSLNSPIITLVVFVFMSFDLTSFRQRICLSAFNDYFIGF